MSKRRYLDIDDVLGIHEYQISTTGGASGLRDAGQLASAIHRPQTGYYPDLIAEAAALWESLSQNHPFVDGNKRTALVSVYVFLGENGLITTAEDTEVWSFILGSLKAGNFTFDRIDAWLRANTESRTD